MHATRTELLARAGKRSEAEAAYRTAIELTDNAAQRAALRARADRLLS